MKEERHEKGHLQIIREVKPGIIGELELGIIGELEPGIIEELEPGIIGELEPGIIGELEPETNRASGTCTVENSDVGEASVEELAEGNGVDIGD